MLIALTYVSRRNDEQKSEYAFGSAMMDEGALKAVQMRDARFTGVLLWRALRNIL